MNGDPLDPITFEQAVYGIAHSIGPLVSSEVGSSPSQRGQVAKSHTKGPRNEQEGSVQIQVTAYGALMGLILVGGIRAWVADGQSWKRPTPQRLKQCFTVRNGESTGIYLDSQDVVSTIAKWPNEYDGFADLAELPATKTQLEQRPDRRKVGRPKGPGFRPSDVPTFELILEEQRASGNVQTEHAVVVKFAGDPNETYFQTNVDRLRKGLRNWLVKNGHKWVPD